MTQLPKNVGIKNPKRRHVNDANYIGKNHRKLNKRTDNGRPWLNKKIHTYTITLRFSKTKTQNQNFHKNSNKFKSFTNMI